MPTFKWKKEVKYVGQSSLYLKDLILLCSKQQLEFKEIKKMKEFVWLQKSNSK